jgi:hypothetical protein
MGKTVLSDGQGSDRTWKDEDKFTARIFNREKVDVGRKGKKKETGVVLRFLTPSGMVERWETTLWARLFDEKALKVGDTVTVEAQKEVRVKGGKNRFRPFSIVKLTKKDIPKSLR